MRYILIKAQISKSKDYDFANFDKEGFERKQDIVLQEKPVSVTIQGDNIILIFEEKIQKTTRPRSFSQPG